MNHMPYEEMILGEGQGDQTEAPGRTRRDGPIDAPGRTPQSAESGADDEHQRRIPGGEPGKTPGSAEGEDPGPSRH